MKSLNLHTCLKQCLKLALITILGVLSACNVDWAQQRNEEKNGEQLVSFSMKVPGGYIPKTYGLTADDENKVSEVLVLLFDKENKYTYQPIFTSAITTDANNPNIKTFTVKIPKKEYGTLMVIANANKNVLEAVKTSKTGNTKQSVIEKLKVETHAPWIEYLSQETTDKRTIPMWGEKYDLDFNEEKNKSIELKLTRALARIDVKSDMSKTNLKLAEVYLYNYNTKGYVVPLHDNWDKTPSVPSDSHTAEKWSYKHIITQGTITQLKNEIYTLEVNKGSSENHIKNTCLVIGGYYKNSTNITYYRIDFVKASIDSYTYLDILRNHLYDVDIQSVNGPGSPNPETALKTKPVNIVAKIEPWNEGNISEAVASGEYFLGLNHSEFEFTKEIQNESNTENTLSIKTNYPKGWHISKIVDLETKQDLLNLSNPWIKMQSKQGNGNQSDTKILLEENNTSMSRSAKIYINAGERMSLVATVQQSSDPKLDIEITNSTGQPIYSLDFASKLGEAVTPQDFNLTWSPTNKTVSTSITPAFAYATGSEKLGEVNYQSSTGEKTLKIIPATILETENNPFEKRISKVTFKVANNGKEVNKVLQLTHQTYGLKLIGLEKVYLLGTGERSFTMQSGGKWKITKVSTRGGKDINNYIDTSRGDIKVGTNNSDENSRDFYLKFYVKGINTAQYIEPETILVTVESTDNKFDKKIIEINFRTKYLPRHHTGWAGSNIYWDGNKLTFHATPDGSVEKIQGVFFKPGRLRAYSPYGDGFELSGGKYSGGVIKYWALQPDGRYKKSSSNYDKEAYDFFTTNLEMNSDSYTEDSTERSRAYLYEITDISKEEGDICRALTIAGHAPTGSWRIPTHNELAELETDNKGPKDTSLHSTNVDEDGRKVLKAYNKFTYSEGTVTLPRSGLRNGINGDYMNWSYGYINSYSSSSFNPTSNPNSKYGLYIGFRKVGLSSDEGMVNQITAHISPIRCVRE